MPNFPRIKTVEHTRHLTFETAKLLTQKNVHPETPSPEAFRKICLPAVTIRVLLDLQNDDSKRTKH